MRLWPEVFNDVTSITGASIEPQARCLIVTSIAKTSGEHDLYVFTSFGSSYWQVTDTPNLDEIQPEWNPKDYREVVYSEGGLLKTVNPLLANVEVSGTDFRVAGKRVLGDHPNYSPDGDFLTYSHWGEVWIVTDDEERYVSEGIRPRINPEQSGLTWEVDGHIEAYSILHEESKVLTFGEILIWDPKSREELRGLVGYSGQRWVYTHEEPVGRLKLNYLADEGKHTPLDWEVPRHLDPPLYEGIETWFESLPLQPPKR